MRTRGTDLIAVHEGLPPGVLAAENELGWRETLDKLAALVEAKLPMNEISIRVSETTR